SAQGPREGEDFYPACAGRAKGRGDRRRGRAGRVDVVDHGDAARRRGGRAKGAAQRAALHGGAVALAVAVQPLEERPARQLPEERELAGEPLRRVVAALEPARTVGRDEGEDIDRGRRQLLRDESRRLRREPAQAALLPGVDEPPRRVVVDDRGPRAREGDPPPRAFAAAVDGPRDRGAAAAAERRLEGRSPSRQATQSWPPLRSQTTQR